MNGAGTMQQLLRSACEAAEQLYPKLRRKPARESAAPAAGSRPIRETSTFRVLEAMPDGKDGEKVFKVILISEGPGNRRNKNFYGAEAVESSVTAFEGKWCYLNHQSADEAETLPERRIQDKAGYFKNLGIMKVAEGTACAGELHCDLSESGKILADKIQSALKYKESFPDNGLEYVGFSVNADGDAEPRDMTDRGGGPDDNYVTAITEGDSCDLVTTPARGGRALKESDVPQEAGMKKKLLSVLSGLMEAAKAIKGDEGKKLSEALKPLAALVKESDMAEESDPEAYAAHHLAKHEGESDEDHAARLHALAKGIHKHLGKAAPAAEAEPEPAADDEEHESPDALESKRDAIASLIKESGLPKDLYTKEMIAALAKKPYLEAKAEIQKDARLAKSIRESVGAPVASFHRGGLNESETDRGADFLEAARGE